MFTAQDNHRALTQFKYSLCAHILSFKLSTRRVVQTWSTSISTARSLLQLRTNEQVDSRKLMPEQTDSLDCMKAEYECNACAFSFSWTALRLIQSFSRIHYLLCMLEAALL